VGPIVDPGEITLEFIEVQMGSNRGEDNIIPLKTLTTGTAGRHCATEFAFVELGHVRPFIEALPN
jgi:hypothetical protein